MHLGWLTLGLALALAGPVAAEVIEGEGTVVDSDVVEVDGKRVMLFGLESIERNQACRMNGQPWACYAAAARQLEYLVSLGPLTCETEGKADRYGRYLARCAINDKDLGEEFVRSGFAVARPDETDAYIAAEREAKAAKVGLWQGKFDRPTEFRFANGIFVDRP